MSGKTIFSKPVISHVSLLQRSKVSLNSRQSFAFKEIYLWRNKVARTEDESEAYILPTHMLIKISIELPREMQGILACCNPIPPLVKQNLLEIHQIILKARELPVTLIPSNESTSPEEDASQIQGAKQVSGVGEDLFENPLKCPLDLGHLAFQPSGDLGFRCVLDKGFVSPDMKQSVIATKESPSINFCQASEDSKSKANLKNFLTPFQRFQLLRPYMTALNDNQENRTRTDEERMKSIREHFDALTAMSAREFQGESNSQENEVEGQEQEQEEDEEEPISSANFNPDPILFKSLRQNLSSAKEADSQRKRSGQIVPETLGKKRRKNKAKVVKDDAKDVDLTNVDFSQFSGGSKKAHGESKDFNPWKGYDSKGKNLKQRQRYKPAGKSVSYKK